MPAACDDASASALAEEAALVAAAQAGDRDAHRHLYVLHVSAVRSFVARRTAPSDVDDVTAETFARGFHELHTFVWRGVSTRAWLMRIAQRELIARARRRCSTELVSETIEGGTSEGHEQSVVDRVSDGQRLGSALSQLTALQQSVLRMRFVDEFPVAGVAAVLNLSPEAVRSLSYRGLCTLRAALGSEPDAAQARL